MSHWRFQYPDPAAAEFHDTLLLEILEQAADDLAGGPQFCCDLLMRDSGFPAERKFVGLIEVETQTFVHAPESDFLHQADDIAQACCNQVSGVTAPAADAVHPVLNDRGRHQDGFKIGFADGKGGKTFAASHGERSEGW